MSSVHEKDGEGGSGKADQQHEAVEAVEADHYDRDDSDEEDEAVRERTNKRRRVDEDEAEQQQQQQHSAHAASKPTAASRQTAEKNRKKGQADDARSTPSIMSYFGGGGKQTEKKKDAAKPDIASFFAPRTAKASNRGEGKKDDDNEKEASERAKVQTETKAHDTVMQHGAEEERPVNGQSVDGSESSKLSTSPTKQQQSDKHDKQPAKATPAKQAAAPTAPTAASRKRSASDSRPAASKATGKGKRGGPMSSMGRKRRAAGKMDDDDEEEGKGEAGKDDIDMSEVIDKEEAAIEEEDAADTSDSDEEDQSELAKELMHTDSTTGTLTSSSTSPLGTASYHPIKHASWSAGQPVPYSALSAMFACVEAETSRLKIIAIVSDFFRSVLALTPQDILPTVYLCINSIAPAYEGKETGVGDFILKKVIAQTTGLSLARLRETAKDVTDLGVLALSSRKKQVTLFNAPPLTVRGVFGVMREMGGMSGKNVASKKEGMITKLMVACKGEEAKFLIRSLQGSLRIGLQIKSVIASLARALVITPPKPAAAGNDATDGSGGSGKQVVDTRQLLSEKKFQTTLEEGLSILKQAYIEVPNLDLLIHNILQYGLQELPQHCTLTAGVPVEVMLGKPASSIVSILDKFSDVLFTLEYKYDGERAQLHRLKDGTVRVYSRNSENNTGKYPDIVRSIKAYEVDGKCTSWIIDCECVAWDKTEKRLLPFQTLTTRKRKDVKEEDITVRVCLTGDHMVLTTSGWKFIGRIIKNVDVVASFNIATSCIEWKRVTDTQQFPAEQHRLYRMQGTYMDVVATEDHSMLVAHMDGQGNLEAAASPIGYETVAQLLPPNQRYETTVDQFVECKERAVLRSGLNPQPPFKFIIQDMENVCDWWWEKDRQLGFLRFVGFWLGDGNLSLVRQTAQVVEIQQVKRISCARLTDLLDEVFPRWWTRRLHVGKDGLNYHHTIRCPPLFEWLRVMACGPAGYHPGFDTGYPHTAFDERVEELEAQSRYRRVALATPRHWWKEEEMLAAFNAGPVVRPCSVCGGARGVRLFCSGAHCGQTDNITRAHPACVGRAADETAFDEPWYCLRCENPEDKQRCDKDSDDEACDRCEHVKCAPERLTAVPKGEWYCPPPGGGGDPEPMETEDDAVVTAVAAHQQFQPPYAYVPGTVIIPWDNGLWRVGDGHWFYLKRWMGPNVAGTFARMSQPQAAALIEGFNRADGLWGAVQHDGNGEPTGIWTATNSSLPLIHHLQLVGQLAGAAVELGLHTKAGAVTKIKGRDVLFRANHWLLRFDFRPSCIPGVRTTALARPADVSDNANDVRGYYVYEDDGFVYDISVEGNHNFLTQRLSTRAAYGEHDSDELGEGVRAYPVFVGNCLFAFDLLYLNGQSYLGHTLRERREVLRAHFVEKEGEFQFAIHKDTTDVDEIQAFLTEAVAASCEGLMVKALEGDESRYTPGKRSWLKSTTNTTIQSTTQCMSAEAPPQRPTLRSTPTDHSACLVVSVSPPPNRCKKDYLDGVGDTLDLVPIAAFYGKGKRTGAYGAYVLACYDDESEEYQSITKIGTGFSEDDITRHAAFYNQPADDPSQPSPNLLPACPRYYKLGDTMKPDVWLAPVQVWEIKCADLSISPVHQAAVGRVDQGKGIALRFPRFVRVREDKKPEDATTAEQVVEMYENQSNRAGEKRKGGDDDD